LGAMGKLNVVPSSVRPKVVASWSFHAVLPAVSMAWKVARILAAASASAFIWSVQPGAPVSQGGVPTPLQPCSMALRSYWAARPSVLIDTPRPLATGRQAKGAAQLPAGGVPRPRAA